MAEKDISEFTKDFQIALQRRFIKDMPILAANIKTEMRVQIQKVVYAAYPKPKRYIRKKDSGGLTDINKNMKHRIYVEGGNPVMEVGNVRKDDGTAKGLSFEKGKDVALLVEGGHGKYGVKYTYTKVNGRKAPYLKARPFMKETTTVMQPKIEKYISKMVKEVVKKDM